jgi:hypothetical protein
MDGPVKLFYRFGLFLVGNARAIYAEHVTIVAVGLPDWMYA